jgi:hypothetical protein
LIDRAPLAVQVFERLSGNGKLVVRLILGTGNVERTVCEDSRCGGSWGTVGRGLLIGYRLRGHETNAVRLPFSYQGHFA